ncbi:hypothetical protein [Okeania sp. SIO2B3]|uniref:hypothetical protein n=1 Tax=Okeania sp. SIO2B3 TaxID=2607784 RepID=UPI0025F29493|nr:hypothetical protein [Okeania sp. SIO2B3]
MSVIQDEKGTQVISGTEEDSLSIEELADTTGSADTSKSSVSELESDADTLLSPEDLHHPIRGEPRADVTKNPLAKTVFVGGLFAVVVVAISLVVMLFNSTGNKQIAKTSTNEAGETDASAEEIKRLQDELYKERAAVAVRNLQSPLQENQEKPKRSRTAKKAEKTEESSSQKPTPKPTSTPKSTPTPKPTPRAAPRPAPVPRTAPAPRPAPTPVPRTAPVPRAAPAPVPRAAPAPAPRTAPVPRAAPAPRPTPIPRAAPTPAPEPEKFDDLSAWTELAALGQVQRKEFEEKEVVSESETPQTQAKPTPAIAPTNNLIASVVVGESIKDGLTPGMQGIINQSSEFTGYKDIEVTIGTTAQGRVVVPLHWNQEIDGTDGLFLVELTEPLVASDGTHALKKGSQLIVSVSFISDAGQVFQSVVAIVHPDGRQETIPTTGSGYNDAPTTPLVIRGKKGNVLIAKKIKGSDASPGLGSDIAVGLMAGIAEAADNITQPEQEVQTQTTGLSSTTTAQQNRQEPRAAFIKGLAETLTERMTERLDSKPKDLKIFQVSRGEKVQLFVNGFVTFRVPKKGGLR